MFHCKTCNIIAYDEWISHHSDHILKHIGICSRHKEYVNLRKFMNNSNKIDLTKFNAKELLKLRQLLEEAGYQL